jgi:transposase
LFPKIKDPEEYHQQVQGVCTVYKEAEVLEAQGIHVYSTDEKTGIQALEHAHEATPIKAGQVERIEHEYHRRGTSGLIASRRVVDGQIVAPMIQPTRTEMDFAQHIRDVIAQDPGAGYRFVMDNLNTHVSESLVLLVIEWEGLEIDPKTLGKKNRSGILKSVETRAAFLSDPTHRIQFIYTPKHTSWLNQIECWFSVLTRRLLNKRSSFRSVKQLEEQLAAWIAYYNEHLAKAYNWKYDGKLLQV